MHAVQQIIRLTLLQTVAIGVLMFLNSVALAVAAGQAQWNLSMWILLTAMKMAFIPVLLGSAAIYFLSMKILNWSRIFTTLIGIAIAAGIVWRVRGAGLPSQNEMKLFAVPAIASLLTWLRFAKPAQMHAHQQL